MHECIVLVKRYTTLANTSWAVKRFFSVPRTGAAAVAQTQCGGEEGTVKITGFDTFVLHVPVTAGRVEDSTHGLSHWGAPGVVLHTDAGIDGYGYTGTHAHLASDRLITDCIDHVFGPLLTGSDPLEPRHVHTTLQRHPPLLWVGRAGITQLALSAIDLALWDIKAKHSELPLWKLLGGNGRQKRIAAYNTDGGWLNWSQSTLVDNARALVAEGYGAVKIKIGSDTPSRDLRRIDAVRHAIGDDVRLMVDANGRWDLATARAVGRHFSDYDVYWFEEPLWFDDVAGHASLARSLDTPLALGEQLYSVDAFNEFIRAGAVQIVQPDAVRLAGITEWWQVADLALAARLPVVPHIGDMMQVHLHLAIAHSACSLLEYIPWLRDCFVEPATVEDGMFIVPDLPGAGTTLRADAIERFGV
jgi:L-alanine-DL-glutamate epimerase-like enolase superfamily enzyme